MFYNHRIKTDLPDYVNQVSLEELYGQSDIIILHVSQTPQTTEMIDAAAIAKMRAGVIVINTARGGLINEYDLTQALTTGKILAAGIDMSKQEPILADSPLLTAKNCYITPHIAWAPKETRKRLLDITISNLMAFLDGKPVNVVN
nr:NAD(P)-dependent oxidoreductase [Lactobacillus sp. ESL0228]